MTTMPAYLQQDADAGEIVQFPEPPPEEMTAYYSVNWPGYPGALADHFGHPETTIITSEVAAALLLTPDWQGVRYPDLLIAFNANPAANRARLGYLIPEQGKPPDFVLEVASDSTYRHDRTDKRSDYARMGVPEYWRFDSNGARPRRTRLAGDRLARGQYLPIPIHRTEDGIYWGRSEALGLDLCWEEGLLRFWDPAARRYLTTSLEERDARRDAETDRDAEAAARHAAETGRDVEAAARRTAETERDAEAAARRDAEARARQLEAELRRLQNT